MSLVHVMLVKTCDVCLKGSSWSAASQLHGRLTISHASAVAVTKLLERAQPSLDAVAARYMGAHDTIVASDAYSAALQSAQEVLNSVQGTPVFAAIFPVIAPTWDVIVHSPYYAVRFSMLLGS